MIFTLNGVLQGAVMKMGEEKSIIKCAKSGWVTKLLTSEKVKCLVIAESWPQCRAGPWPGGTDTQPLNVMQTAAGSQREARRWVTWERSGRLRSMGAAALWMICTGITSKWELSNACCDGSCFSRLKTVPLPWS